METIIPASVPPSAVAAQPGASSTNGLTKLTKDDLLSALDAQITFITAERRSAGWTRWAIWGALATLTWLGTDLFNHPELSSPPTTLLALGIFVLWRLLEMVAAMFSPSTRASIAPNRFRVFAEVISAVRLELVVSVARYVLILFALVWFGFERVTLLWVYAVAALLFNGGVFAYGILPLAFPTKHKSRVIFENLPTFVAMGVLLGALIQIAVELKHFSPGLNLAEVRLAIIFNAVAHLFNWLASDTSAAPLLEHLKQVRQDLAFGRISLDEATRHADVTLSGLKLTEALHPAVSAALTKAGELQGLLSCLKELTVEADKVLADIRQDDQEYQVNGERGARLMRLLDQLDQGLAGVSAKKTELQNAVVKLQISSQLIVLFSPESKSEVESITAKVAKAIVEARKEEVTSTQQIASLKTAAN
ncbi:MAG TPA: hypothetical protein VNX46_01345, partial [Candidatus Acidoferrum sp.]|nr:hypothetical protein [Candidatus Acidoferrum sp.]